MQPLISIIVPVYNVERYLDKCIDSIVNQTYKNLEIILVDDGSPDNCPKICDEWAKKDSRIKVIHKENGGVSSARNRGLDEATGDYIAFVDADDYIDLCFYEKMIECANENKVGYIQCSINRESPNGYTEHWGKINSKIRIYDSRLEIIELCSTLNLVCMHVGNKFFSKETIGNTRFDTRYRYNEDLLFLFEVLLGIDKVVYIDEPMYHFYYNTSSSTHKKNRESVFDDIKIADKLYKMVPQDLQIYCVRGDMLKTFNKIQELLLDGSLTKQEYKSLRARILKRRKIIFKSNIILKYTKIKTFVIWLFPNTFKILMKIYAKKQIEKNERKYLG